MVALNLAIPLLPWLQPYWEELAQYLQQQRVPQALLIHGQKGLGKHYLAQQFAQALLCSQLQHDGLACGACRSCQLFQSETHPDLIQVEPEETGKPISVAQIRQLIGQLSLKPQYDSFRVIIVAPAEQMNKAAANAFLKYLEEPTERTILILITDKLAKLPATVISRCQKLFIATPLADVSLDWLKLQSEQDAQVLLALANGSPLIAKTLSMDGSVALRVQCFESWCAVGKKATDPVKIAESWLNLPEETLLFWITSWLADMIKCHFDIDVRYLYNPDLQPTLKELSQQLELVNIFKLYDLLLVCSDRINSQLNKQLMYEEILIQWSEFKRGK
ncbi:MAG: DNA polymerase III subunit delta' [Methylococcaceae bacterium]|jgi:DNA polymerase-3 subunit delta'